MEYEKREDNVMCLQCGDRIEYGRADKKFCCLRCKNRYHNSLSSQSKRSRQITVGILESNYKILENLLRSGLTSISLEDASRLGYNPAIFTSSHRAGRGSTYYCFDISYKMSETRLFKMQRIQK